MRRQIRSDLAQAYFELLALDVRLEIARNSTDAYQRTYNVFEDRFRFGAASKLETSRAEGALGEAQATIPQIESDIVAKENQIGVLLGTSPAPVPRGTPMYEQVVVPTVPAGLPSTLLERRPDLRQAEQQVVSANARIGVAKAEFFPKLSLTALLGTASPEISAITSGGSLVWAVAAGLTGPIFQGGRILQNYRATLAERDQAIFQYQQAVITALRDETGELRGFGKVTRDVSDRHNDEERLREHAKRMAELEDAKTQFLDLAAHELRGPLTLIRGYNSMLQDGAIPPEQIPQVARVLEGKLAQIDLLVEQMLEVALALSHRLYVMDQGRIQFEGTPEALRRDPTIQQRFLSV